MSVTRNVNGAIQINGRRINMYTLTCWLVDRNRRTGESLRLSTLTETHLREYLGEPIVCPLDDGQGEWGRTQPAAPALAKGAA